MRMIIRPTDLPSDITFFTVIDNRVSQVTDEADLLYFMSTCISWKSSPTLELLETYRDIFLSTCHERLEERIKELEIQCIRLNRSSYNNFNTHGLFCESLQEIDEYMRSMLTLTNPTQKKIYDSFLSSFRSWYANPYATTAQALNLLRRFNILVFTGIRGYLDYDLPYCE